MSTATAQQPELMPEFEELEKLTLEKVSLESQLAQVTQEKTKAENRLNRKVQQLEKIIPMKECSEIVATLNCYWAHLNGCGFENIELINLADFSLIEMLTAFNTISVYSPEFIQFDTGHEFVAAAYLASRTRAGADGQPRPLAYVNGLVLFAADEQFKIHE